MDSVVVYLNDNRITDINLDQSHTLLSIESEKVFEAYSISDNEIYCDKHHCHPFIDAIITAHKYQYPLAIDVDSIKFLILQQYRRLIGNSRKNKVTIIRDDFIRGEYNKWESTFDQFIDDVNEIIKIIGDPLLLMVYHSSMEISDIEECNGDPLLSMVYLSSIKTSDIEECNGDLPGIQSIRLVGNICDWKNAISIIEEIGKINESCKLWCMMLKPILQEFLRTMNGKPDLRFWKKIIFERNGVFNGWIMSFFPFLEKDYFTPKDIPNIISIVDFDWIDENEILPMKFFAKFVGISVENGCISPKILWGIEDLVPKNFGKFFNSFSELKI